MQQRRRRARRGARVHRVQPPRLLGPGQDLQLEHTQPQRLAQVGGAQGCRVHVAENGMPNSVLRKENFLDLLYQLL